MGGQLVGHYCTLAERIHATAPRMARMAVEGVGAHDADQLKADFKAYGEIMTEEWLKSAGDAGKAVVDAYKSM